MIVSDIHIWICLVLFPLTMGLPFGYLFRRLGKPEKRKTAFWFGFGFSAFAGMLVAVIVISKLPQIIIIHPDRSYSCEYIVGSGTYQGHTVHKDGHYLINNTGHPLYEVEVIYETYNIKRHYVKGRSQPQYTHDVHAIELGRTAELPIGEFSELRDFPKGFFIQISDTIKYIEKGTIYNEMKFFYITSTPQPAVNLSPHKKQ